MWLNRSRLTHLANSTIEDDANGNNFRVRATIAAQHVEVGLTLSWMFFTSSFSFSHSFVSSVRIIACDPVNMFDCYCRQPVQLFAKHFQFILSFNVRFLFQTIPKRARFHHHHPSLSHFPQTTSFQYESFDVLVLMTSHKHVKRIGASVLYAAHIAANDGCYLARLRTFWFQPFYFTLAQYAAVYRLSLFQKRTRKARKGWCGLNGFSWNSHPKKIGWFRTVVCIVIRFDAVAAQIFTFCQMFLVQNRVGYFFLRERKVFKFPIDPMKLEKFDLFPHRIRTF